MPTPLKLRLSCQMGCMFFTSGAAALVYQVLFAKELALVFGSTATATFTVLATFLGGMAIGSLIGGALAARGTRQLLVYALVELAIGVYCLVTPTLFSWTQWLYVAVASDLPPAAPGLLALRVGLGAAVLLIPTVLMGITLPLLAQALNPLGDRLGTAVAWLYACNTSGAACGALLTSYAVIPMLGVHMTTLMAAVLNGMVALAAVALTKSLQMVPLVPHSHPEPSVQPPRHRDGRGILTGALLALGLGGVLSLGLEVVYVHLLSIVAGNSVYAFGLMLATFLIGLAIGGEGGRRLLERDGTDCAAWLATTQLALAATVALGSWGWDWIPVWFISLGQMPALASFEAREAVRALVCTLVMIPPAICIGASYTLAMDLATSPHVSRRAFTMLGLSAALNTLGNIIGVVLFGFILLPWLGGLVASKIVALGALLVATAVSGSVLVHATRQQLGAALAAAIALVLLSPDKLDYDRLSKGASVYFTAQNWGAVVAQAESIDGGLTMVTRQASRASGIVINTLLTNGKFQGNDAKQGEVQAQIGFAALPLLHQDLRQNALVIGYGTGATSRVLHDAGFIQVEIAELSRDVVAMADRYFSGINAGVSHAPGVEVNITDGRNMLLLTRRQYDVISIEITSIWFAGAASLYNREFYRLVRTRLRPQGVLQQWVQLHHMASTDLLTIIATLRAEFSYVSLYVVGGQGILIATNDIARAQTSPVLARALDSAPALESVRSLAGRSFATIASDLLLSPAMVDVLLDRYGARTWISTDNNLKLEYSTPKANAVSPDRSFAANLKLLQRIAREAS